MSARPLSQGRPLPALTAQYSLFVCLSQYIATNYFSLLAGVPTQTISAEEEAAEIEQNMSVVG